jgi:hypothetical protein
MSMIVVLAMAESGHEAELDALRKAGHELVVLEPRFPACREALGELRPALVVVDGSHAPSHGRAVASWMAGQPRYRTIPFLFVDVADREMARVKKELPRAQFATWSSVVGASDRLAKRSE